MYCVLCILYCVLCIGNTKVFVTFKRILFFVCNNKRAVPSSLPKCFQKFNGGSVTPTTYFLVEQSLELLPPLSHTSSNCDICHKGNLCFGLMIPIIIDNSLLVKHVTSVAQSSVSPLWYLCDHPITDHKGPEGELRCSSTLYLTSVLDGG